MAGTNRVNAVDTKGFDGVMRNYSNTRSSSQQHQSQNDAPIFDELLNSAIETLNDKMTNSSTRQDA